MAESDYISKLAENLELWRLPVTDIDALDHVFIWKETAKLRSQRLKGEIGYQGFRVPPGCQIINDEDGIVATALIACFDSGDIERAAAIVDSRTVRPDGGHLDLRSRTIVMVSFLAEAATDQIRDAAA